MDEMKTAYDEHGIPYLVEAEGSEAKHIIELLAAEAQGRLVVLPCKVGDTVYILCRVGLHVKIGDMYNGLIVEDNCDRCAWHGTYSCGQITYPNTITMKDHVSGLFIFKNRSLFGKTWFLTRELAEAALQANGDAS